MRRTLCTLLYKLRLHRLAKYVSPSIYWYLCGKEVRDAMLAGIEAAIASIHEKGETT